jgi:hypothetical protein
MMTEYVAEAYLSTARETELSDAAARARIAAQELAESGVRVRHLRSVFMPAEETSFHFFDAASEDDVRELLTRAGLEYERLGPVVTAEPGRGGTE